MVKWSLPWASPSPIRLLGPLLPSSPLSGLFFPCPYSCLEKKNSLGGQLMEGLPYVLLFSVSMFHTRDKCHSVIWNSHLPPSPPSTLALCLSSLFFNQPAGISLPFTILTSLSCLKIGIRIQGERGECLDFVCNVNIRLVLQDAWIDGLWIICSSVLLSICSMLLFNFFHVGWPDHFLANKLPSKLFSKCPCTFL